MTEPPLSRQANENDRQAIEALEAAFRHIAVTRMAGVPILNPALNVEAVGFQRVDALDGRWLGVLITPWFMNLICLPLPGDDWDQLPSGTGREMALPNGRVEFLAASEERFGAYLSCSLFSPMQAFEDQDYARSVAEEVLAEFLGPPAADASQPAPEPRGIAARMEKPVSRRGFLSAFLPRGD